MFASSMDARVFVQTATTVYIIDGKTDTVTQQVSVSPATFSSSSYNPNLENRRRCWPRERILRRSLKLFPLSVWNLLFFGYLTLAPR